MSMITIFHGSPSVIEKPMLGKGKPHNDYGSGFYTTSNIELAKEWACPEAGQDGYANKYILNDAGLKVYNIASGRYNILNWMALLLNNRHFKISGGISESAKAYLLENFMPPFADADVLIGYRADDSYFSYANAFLNNGLSLQQLEQAMYLGNLGEQIVLKSEKAFAKLLFDGFHIADAGVYYPLRQVRDVEARKVYKEQVSVAKLVDSVYILDIIRGGWKDDDARLSRNIPR
jgi:hypothetical protein